MAKSVYWTCVNESYFQKILLLGDIFRVPICHLTSRTMTDYTKVLFLEGNRQRGFLKYEDKGEKISFELWSKIGKILGQFDSINKKEIYFQVLPNEKDYDVLEGHFKAMICQPKKEIHQSMKCTCKKGNLVFYAFQFDNFHANFRLYKRTEQSLDSIFISKKPHNHYFHEAKQKDGKTIVTHLEESQTDLTKIHPIIQEMDPHFEKLQEEVHSAFRFPRLDLYQNIISACQEECFTQEETLLATGVLPKIYIKNRPLIQELNACRK